MHHSLQLATDTRDTYAGMLLSVTHNLSCVMKTPTCVTDPEVAEIYAEIFAEIYAA